MTDFIEQQLYRPQPEDSAFTGAYQINYPDSSVHFEGELQGGQPVGLWRSFYPSGRIQSTVTYDKKGRATGEAFFYYDAPDEARQAVVPFQKGQPHGIYREYYLNGARKAEIQYEEGKKDGDALFFHETGALKIEGFYKDHEKHRRWQFYNENGDEVGHERWRRGEKKA